MSKVIDQLVTNIKKASFIAGVQYAVKMATPKVHAPRGTPAAGYIEWPSDQDVLKAAAEHADS